MEHLVTQGKVIYVGSSNFAGWHIATANQIALRRHFLDLVSEQSLHNLISRDIELEVISACRYYGLAVLPWSPLHSSVLAGVHQTQSSSRRQSEFTLRLIDK